MRHGDTAQTPQSPVVVGAAARFRFSGWLAGTVTTAADAAAGAAATAARKAARVASSSAKSSGVRPNCAAVAMQQRRRNAHSTARQMRRWQQRRNGRVGARTQRHAGGSGRGRSAAHVVFCLFVGAALHQQRNARDVTSVRGVVQRHAVPLRASAAVQRSGRERRQCTAGACAGAHKQRRGAARRSAALS
jgi:hypothetical protein